MLFRCPVPGTMVHYEAELDVDHFALRPQKRGCLLGTGTWGKRARE